MDNLHSIATLAISFGLLSLFCLLLLHFLSPEYKISWRMISEYALGKHKPLITLFFIFWALCSFLTALLLWNMVDSIWAHIGVALVFVSGVGALMGGLFDVKHKLHGLAFALGIPTLPIGALLISYHLIALPGWSEHQSTLLLFTHSLWVSVLLMAFTMMLLFSGVKKAGLPMGPNVEAPKSLPKGVIPVNGYANRLLVLCFIGWLMYMAETFLNL